MNFDDVLAGLSPQLRKKVLTAEDLKPLQYAETPSIGLNNALGGGFVYGRQHLIYGNKSSGKSSMLLQTIAREQAKGKSCAWVDAEMTFDKSWAKRMGVDTSKLILSSARTVNDMVDVGVDLMGAGIDLFTVDSISSLLPAVYFEKDSTDLKQLENTKQIGAEARDMTNAVKMLNYANNQVNETAIMLISQTRNQIGAMYASIVPTGGKAVQFYSSTIVQLFSSESDNQAIKGKIKAGDKLLEEKVGRRVRWDLKFSKTSPAFQSGEYDFYFRGDNLGVDTVGDIVDTAIGQGIIVRAGAWYAVNDARMQGRDAVVDYVRSNPDVRANLEGMILNVES